MNQDEEHLRLLSIFYYVLGGLGCFCASFPILHFAMGIALLSGALPGPNNQPEAGRFFGAALSTFAGVMILVGWSVAIATIVAGRFLSKQRHYTFCLVVAAILCLSVPLGTVLGVFTIIVLMRPSAKELFEQQAAWNPPPRMPMDPPRR